MHEAPSYERFSKNTYRSLALAVPASQALGTTPTWIRFHVPHWGTTRLTSRCKRQGVLYGSYIR